MGTINTTKQKVEDTSSHLNWMGGKSFDLKNPIHTLRMAATSCFFGEPQYYHEGTEKTKIAKSFPHSKTINEDQLRLLRDTLEAQDPQEWRDLSPTVLLENA